MDEKKHNKMDEKKLTKYEPLRSNSKGWYPNFSGGSTTKKHLFFGVSSLTQYSISRADNVPTNADKNNSDKVPTQKYS